MPTRAAGLGGSFATGWVRRVALPIGHAPMRLQFDLGMCGAQDSQSGSIRLRPVLRFKPCSVASPGSLGVAAPRFIYADNDTGVATSAAVEETLDADVEQAVAEAKAANPLEPYQILISPTATRSPQAAELNPASGLSSSPLSRKAPEQLIRSTSRCFLQESYTASDNNTSVEQLKQTSVPVDPRLIDSFGLAGCSDRVAAIPDSVTYRSISPPRDQSAQSAQYYAARNPQVQRITAGRLPPSCQLNKSSSSPVTSVMQKQLQQIAMDLTLANSYGSPGCASFPVRKTPGKSLARLVRQLERSANRAQMQQHQAFIDGSLFNICAQGNPEDSHG